MANTFLTTKVIAREALMVLRNNAVMANLVHRDYSSEFIAGRGDTISIRKPNKFEAKEFTTKIELQDTTEQSIEVKMDKLLDVSFPVTSKEMTMDIVDFSEQLLVPAMQAFNDKIDGYLIAAGAASTNKVVQAKAVTPADMITARKILTKNAAPLRDRRFVYNTDTEADLLANDKFTDADRVGDSGTALREASLGRKYGMDLFVDQNMDASTAKALAFHKNGLALVTRMLEKPMGGVDSEIVNYDGFALRVVYGYDQSTKTNTVSIDMLCGVATLYPELIAKIAGE